MQSRCISLMRPFTPCSAQPGEMNHVPAQIFFSLVYSGGVSRTSMQSAPFSMAVGTFSSLTTPSSDWQIAYPRKIASSCPSYLLTVSIIFCFISCGYSCNANSRYSLTTKSGSSLVRNSISGFRMSQAIIPNLMRIARYPRLLTFAFACPK